MPVSVQRPGLYAGIGTRIKKRDTGAAGVCPNPGHLDVVHTTKSFNVTKCNNHAWNGYQASLRNRGMDLARDAPVRFGRAIMKVSANWQTRFSRGFAKHCGACRERSESRRLFAAPSTVIAASFVPIIGAGNMNAHETGHAVRGLTSGHGLQHFPFDWSGRVVDRVPMTRSWKRRQGRSGRRRQCRAYVDVVKGMTRLATPCRESATAT